MSKIKDIDIYLLLEVSQEATEKDIKKAYRKKSLKCHPDKNPDDPNAAKKFHQLNEALAVLSDVAARKAYDNVLKAKKANELRNRQLDEKRKRLKDQLEARETEAAKEVKESFYDKRSDEEKLAAEIERVMKEGRKELEEEQERIQKLIAKEKEQAKYNDNSNKPGGGPTKIKVRWKSSTEWNKSENQLYTSESLQAIFSKYGNVNVVVVSGTSTARKGSALIEMSARSEAEMASTVERGYEENPLKVKLISDSTQHNVTEASSSANIEESTNLHSAQQSSNFQDYESLVLRKMRQAEERKRLEQEIIEQDKLE